MEELVLKFRSGLNATDGYVTISPCDGFYGLHVQAGSASIAVYLTRAQIKAHIVHCEQAIGSGIIVTEGDHLDIGS